jgi:hypothetical protein
MSNSIVSIVRYEEPLKSVQRAVELSHGLDHMPPKARVFIKPNIVFWTKVVPFPKWGVITTSRVVADMVVLLKERGVDDITIGEGTVVLKARDLETPAHAFKTLGYHALKKRYGVKFINVFERPFEKVDLGDGIELNPGHQEPERDHRHPVEKEMPQRHTGNRSAQHGLKTPPSHASHVHTLGWDIHQRAGAECGRANKKERHPCGFSRCALCGHGGSEGARV